VVCAGAGAGAVCCARQHFVRLFPSQSPRVVLLEGPTYHNIYPQLFHCTVMSSTGQNVFFCGVARKDTAANTGN
jgi:hypothetical protein